MQTAAEIIRGARLEAGLTQTEAALRAGITQSTLSLYENGRRDPSLTTLGRIIDSWGGEVRIVVETRTRERPSESLRRHREEVLALLAAAGITETRVFGSVARDEDTVDSDIDLLVTPGRQLSLLDLAGLQVAGACRSVDRHRVRAAGRAGVPL